GPRERVRSEKRVGCRQESHYSTTVNRELSAFYRRWSSGSFARFFGMQSLGGASSAIPREVSPGLGCRGSGRAGSRFRPGRSDNDHFLLWFGARASERSHECQRNPQRSRSQLAAESPEPPISQCSGGL